MYDGAPPWEINRPQHVFAELAASGALRGMVLDAGCGTGEHALLAAELGLDSTGVDSSPTAIETAARKARDRGLRVRFLVMDALDLGGLGKRFETVLDAGLLHTLDDEQRETYVDQLRHIVPASSHVFVLCFSDLQPGENGPRRLSEAELRATFDRHWHVERILRTTMDSVEGEGAVQALLGEFTPR
jgi:cyclopropane fatty-acyl-phospholipid synthase-like methyltransferase